MNVTFQLRRKYSLGSNSSVDSVHTRLRHQWSSMCSRKFGTHPAPHSTADMLQAGEAVEHAAVDELATSTPTRRRPRRPCCCRPGSCRRTARCALCMRRRRRPCACPPGSGRSGCAPACPSCSAAAQNGSSSARSSAPPRRVAPSRITPRKPAAFARAATRPQSSMSTGGHLRQPEQARGIGGDELVAHPRVVRLDAGEVIVVVLLGHERAHRALRRDRSPPRRHRRCPVRPSAPCRRTRRRGSCRTSSRTTRCPRSACPTAPAFVTRPSGIGGAPGTSSHASPPLRVLHQPRHAVVELLRQVASATCRAARSCARRPR